MKNDGIATASVSVDYHIIPLRLKCKLKQGGFAISEYLVLHRIYGVVKKIYC